MVISTFPPLTSIRLVSYSIALLIVIEEGKGNATSSNVCICVHTCVCKTIHIYYKQYLNFTNLKNVKECHLYNQGSMITNHMLFASVR